MESTTSITPTVTRWQLVDGPTACEFARYAQSALDSLPAGQAHPSLIEVADYVTRAALGFMEAHADADWGVTHDWIDSVDAFWEVWTTSNPVPWLDVEDEDIDDDCAGGFLAAMLVPAEEQAADYDSRIDAAGASLARSLDAVNIRCRHYGDGVIEVDWDRDDADLRVVVGDLGEGLVIDVLALSYDEMAPPVMYDEDIPWNDFNRLVNALSEALAPF